MLNRKNIKSASVETGPQRGITPAKAPAARRRFVLTSRKTHAPASTPPPPTVANGQGAAHPNADPKAPASNFPPGVTVNPNASDIDLTETVKTLLHLAQENGYVTYDDINDILPDGLNPDDLDQLFTKLRNLDVEIVDQAEAERAKPAEPEEDEDARLEILEIGRAHV